MLFLDVVIKVHNPYRQKYHHSYNSDVCPFCNQEIIEKQNIKLLEGSYWMVFVNLYPILDGNLMLVTKRHVEDTSDLNENEWKELKEKIEETKAVLSRVFETKSFNVGFNVGPDSGSSVRHLHWQVIPRIDRQVMNGFSGFIAGIHTVRISPEELKSKIEKAL
ncbi:MAG: AP-4-A phosphorylase [Microgenomates group bacterium ADurb.Bin238]|nr:MAG: AP-4-A phosphorylase [Microgenomates group bacterium ADurb.Bin238]